MLAAAITERHFQRHPELEPLYGKRGRQHCQQDASYHLHFLAEAIALHSPAIFVQYLAWARIMLAARAIDARELEQNLITMQEVLAEQAPVHRDVLGSFVEEALQALPAMPSAAPQFLDENHSVANQFLSALLRLDRAAAAQILKKELARGTRVAELFETVITPVQREVGRLWQENRITVIQEHYCTASIEVLLAEMRRDFLGIPRSSTAVCLCPAEEDHCLALKMFADLLQADGWSVVYIGARSPLAAAAEFMANQRVELVAISVTVAMHLTSVVALIQAIRKRSSPSSSSKTKGGREGPFILVGGAAVVGDPSLRQKLGADGYATTVSEGLRLANELVAKKSA